MTGVGVASLDNLSTAIACSLPLIGAILADCIIGDFWVILVGAGLLVIPGLILIALTTIPGLLGESFNGCPELGSDSAQSWKSGVYLNCDEHFRG